MIPSADLADSRSRGGAAVNHGIDFQKDYAVLQLANLIAGTDELIAVRYEGVEDVDLKYKNGDEKYVQLKNEPGARYTLAALRRVFQNFAVDLLRVGPQPAVKLVLIARSNNLDKSVQQLVDGKPDRAEIVKQLQTHTDSSPVPPELTSLSPQQLLELTDLLLSRLELHFGRGDEEGQRTLFELMACRKLAERGINETGAQESAVSVLRSSLAPRVEFTVDDVERLLAPYVQGTAAGIFDGAFEMLSSTELPVSAESDRIQRFYEGHPPGWDIISSGADIPRDHFDTLFERVTASTTKARIICLSGEPGTGKTTLTLRLGWEAYTRRGIPVLQMQGTNTSGWNRLGEFHARIRRHFIVIVDDAFRRPDIIRPIDDVNPKIPVTILTSARPGEYRESRYKLPIEEHSIGHVSDSEFETLAKRLGRDDMIDTSDLRDSPILVLATTFSTGKGIRAHFEDVLLWLQERDPVLYRAYLYICFAFQYDVAIPESVIVGIEPPGNFFNLLSRRHASSVIFHAVPRERIRATHVIVARTVMQILNPSPTHLVQDIAAALDVDDPSHRSFLAHLLRSAADAGAAIPLSSLVREILDACVDRGSLSEISVWCSYYKRIGATTACGSLIARAIELATSHSDWASITGMAEGTSKDILPLLGEWLERNPGDSAIYRFYLRLLAEGNSDALLPATLRFWRSRVHFSVEDSVCALQMLSRYFSWQCSKVRSRAPDGAVRNLFRELIKFILDHADDHPNPAEMWNAVISLLNLYPDEMLECKVSSAILNRAPMDHNITGNAVRLMVRSASEGAEQELAHLYHAHAANAPAEFRHAFIAEIQTRYRDLALRLCESETEADGTNARIWRRYGLLLLRVGEHQRAVLALEKALSLDPRNRVCLLQTAEAHRAVALQAQATGDQAAAASHLERAQSYAGLLKEGFRLKKKHRRRIRKLIYSSGSLDGSG